jgi:hypothetical protein
VNPQEPVEIVRKETGGIFSNPVVLTLVALLVGSLIGNVVMALALLAR